MIAVQSLELGHTIEKEIPDMNDPTAVAPRTPFELLDRMMTP